MTRENPFKFKVIETKYKGCKMRSRAEARWAVFFDALGLAWEYEKEGYDLEGTWYLPDFWLPEMDSFIEIKGASPTEEEVYKARQLALYTGKEVYIISGQIAPPYEVHSYTIHREHPLFLAVQQYDEKTGTFPYRDIEMSWKARTLLQRLDEAQLWMEVTSDHLSITSKWTTRHRIDDLPYYIEVLEKQHSTLTKIAPLLHECRDELFQIFNLQEDQYLNYVGQDFGTDEMEWFECFDCKKIVILDDEASMHKHDNVVNDSPRLIAAYEAARQARF